MALTHTNDPTPAPPGSAIPGFRQRDPAPPLPAGRNTGETDARIEDMGIQLDELARIGKDVKKLVDQMRQPAKLETVKLTASRIKATIDQPTPAFSIGLYNPTSITVYWGVGGGIAEPNREAITSPARSLLVLPLGGTIIEIGAAAADLVAGDAVLYALLYPTVQPAFFAAI